MTLACTSDNQQPAAGFLSVALALTVLIKFLVPLGSSNSVTIITIETKIRTAVNSQEWLLDNTTNQDQILLWADGPWNQGDRELYVAAGMQLWGENRVTLEPTLTDEYGMNQLKTIKPDVLALHGKSMDSVMTFWDSIPKANYPTAPICYDYAWPPDTSSDFPTTQGHTCLTRLTW